MKEKVALIEKVVKIKKRLKHDYEYVTNKGYKVFGIFLQGSQNYHLDYDGSDIDTKCIIIPTFEDIVLNANPVSTTLVLEDNSHIDLKDIRLMWHCFLKQNINFLEILFTEYFYIPDEGFRKSWEQMQEIKEDIAHYNNYAAVNCIAGMVFEKHKALCHPYPTLKDKIEKYGYDNKQLHHIIRCHEFLERYIKGASYSDCLIPIDPEYLIRVKSSYIYSLEDAKDVANILVEEVKGIKDRYMDNNPLVINEYIKDKMDEFLVDIMKYSLLEDLHKN